MSDYIMPGTSMTSFCGTCERLKRDLATLRAALAAPRDASDEYRRGVEETATLLFNEWAKTGRPSRESWMALRAALAAPRDASDEYRRGEAWHVGHATGYRQGVEDAARVVLNIAVRGVTPIPLTQNYIDWVLAEIRALAQPAAPPTTGPCLHRTHEYDYPGSTSGFPRCLDCGATYGENGKWSAPTTTGTRSGFCSAHREDGHHECSICYPPCGPTTGTYPACKGTGYCLTCGSPYACHACLGRRDAPLAEGGRSVGDIP